LFFSIADEACSLQHKDMADKLTVKHALA